MEVRNVRYGEKIKAEAYRLKGCGRSFPVHFHEHYTVGYMEKGERRMICGGREYVIRSGDMLIFNPRDSHSCSQSGGTMDFAGLNIPEDAMAVLAEEITGTRALPRFGENVIRDSEAAECFLELHECIMSGNSEPRGEEKLLLLITMLMRRCADGTERLVPECGAEIGRVRVFLEQHYPERITLEQMCRCAGLSKSTLLRAFTREMRITPYCYLENIRICEAKKLLEKGVLPAEAALKTGFYDQSHFTAYFTRFIGMSPGEYQSESGSKK